MTASQRWRRLVRARLAEMERLEPGRGTVGAEYWNRSLRPPLRVWPAAIVSWSPRATSPARSH